MLEMLEETSLDMEGELDTELVLLEESEEAGVEMALLEIESTSAPASEKAADYCIFESK